MLDVLECTKMICCMALIVMFSIKHYNSDRPTILLASFGLIENGAGYGNRTHLSGLEGRRTSRCTNPAYGGDAPKNAPEKIGTLKKGGEDFLNFLYLYYTKNFLKNQLIF